ncbi:MAG: hypothetical protein Kow0096_10390 [Thiohalomonadaceae bacterium]
MFQRLRHRHGQFLLLEARGKAGDQLGEGAIRGKDGVDVVHTVIGCGGYGQACVLSLQGGLQPAVSHPLLLGRLTPAQRGISGFPKSRP